MIKTNLLWTRIHNEFTAAINGTFAMHLQILKRDRQGCHYEGWIEDMETGSRLVKCQFADTERRNHGWAREKAANILYNKIRHLDRPELTKAIEHRLHKNRAHIGQDITSISLKTALELIDVTEPHQIVEIAEYGTETAGLVKCFSLQQIRETMDMQAVRVIGIKVGYTAMRLVIPWPLK